MKRCAKYYTLVKEVIINGKATLFHIENKERNIFSEDLADSGLKGVATRRISATEKRRKAMKF